MPKDVDASMYKAFIAVLFVKAKNEEQHVHIWRWRSAWVHCGVPASGILGSHLKVRR